MAIGIIIALLLFAVIAWQRVIFAWAIFFFLLPTYLIRFHIGPLPTTFLEMMLIVLLVVWLVRTATQPGKIQDIVSLVKKHRVFFFACALFFITATLSLFTAVTFRAALGEWRAFYVEPMLVALMLTTTLKEKKHLRMLLCALVLSGLVTGVLALVQKQTGFLVPWKFWENLHTYRVTGWYGFPNAVAFYLALIIPIAIFLAQEFWKEKKYVPAITALAYLPIGMAGILFAKSAGGLMGMVGSIGILLLWYKKTRWYALATGILGLMCLFFVPQFSSFKHELLLQDRSGQIRVGIWKETLQFLKDRPLAGAGIASYEERIVPYHTTVGAEGIEIFHHPHNTFLTMWVNLGLFGMIAFVLCLVWFFVQIARMKDASAPYLLATMAVFLVIGLADSPYIKNDLAMFFWFLPAWLLILTHEKSLDTLHI